MICVVGWLQKSDTRIDEIDDPMIGLYVAGLLIRDICTHPDDVGDTWMLGDLIRRVKDADLVQVSDWQTVRWN